MTAGTTRPTRAMMVAVAFILSMWCFPACETRVRSWFSRDWDWDAQPGPRERRPCVDLKRIARRR